jgi:hypothetical protein
MPSSPPPSPDATPDRREGDRRRRLIHEAYGTGARIRLLGDAPGFGGNVVVVDLDDGPQHCRLLGTFRAASDSPPGTDRGVIALSVMDLISPSRLVLHYEQLMSLALALCARPATALLLGVGGAAMWRFLRAHLPACTTTLVEKDATIEVIARRWFYLDQPVVIDSGEHFLAGTTGHFDAILADLNDAHGSLLPAPEVWAHCLDALAPGGCLATNWPDHATNGGVRPSAEAQAALARARGHDCFFIARRGLADNIVQYVCAAEGRGPAALAGALGRLATEHGLPDGDRILEDCIVSPAFPVAG